MAKVLFKSGTSAQYNALGTKKDNNTLYFITDTHKIYKGDTDFTDSVIIGTSFPESGLQGKIYINSNTSEAKIYVGSTWKTISPPTVDSISTSTTKDDSKLPTVGAVKSYVQLHEAELAGPVGTGHVSVDNSSIHVDENGKISVGTINQSNVSGLTTALGNKAPINNPTFTGTVTAPTIINEGMTVTNENDDALLETDRVEVRTSMEIYGTGTIDTVGTDNKSIVNKGYVDDKVNTINQSLDYKMDITGGSFSGAVDVIDPTDDNQAANKKYVDNVAASTLYDAKDYADSILGANDAMVFKGTIGTGGTVTSLPTEHETGWTYKVITTGTYAGYKCEIGDMIICIADGTAVNNAHWTVVQNNIDGAVTGPTSAVANRVVTFNGTTGKIIKDSGYTIASNVPANAEFTDTTYVLEVGPSTRSGNSGASFDLLGSDGSLRNIYIEGSGSIDVSYSDEPTNPNRGSDGVITINGTDTTYEFRLTSDDIELGNGNTRTDVYFELYDIRTNKVASGVTFQPGDHISISSTSSAGGNILTFNVTNFTASEILMTGYKKASSVSAITVLDSVSTAIGKLEKSLDNKAASTHNHPSSQINKMTGYSKPASSSNITVNDTLNAAIGKLETGLDSKAPKTDPTFTGVVNADRIYINDDNTHNPSETVVLEVNGGIGSEWGQVATTLDDGNSIVNVNYLNDALSWKTL